MGLLDRFHRSRPLTPAAAAAGVQERRLLLVDVRDAAEFASGHAPGARHVPLVDVAGSTADLLAAGVPVAFICRSGMRSAMAMKTARRAGLDAANVRGGMLAWERAGLAVERGAPKRRRRAPIRR